MKTDFDVKVGIDAIANYLKHDESLKVGDSDGMDGVEARTTQAIWAGSLSVELGLKGRADEAMFSILQDGFLPNGDRMRGRHQTGQEILYHDTTLSAPKSFTLHALEDIRLFDAHITACQKTITAAEQHYAVYLQGEDRHPVLGQGIVAAIIPHWTNRNLEPQLHSHCAIFNGTKTQEDRWLSLHMHPLSRERWLGSYYRNVLAQESQAIGYKIYETPMENRAWGFEIDGLSRDQIEVFSTRTAEIEFAKSKGMDGNAATLRTRKAKGAQPSWQELRESTRQARDEIGATLQIPIVGFLPIGKTNPDEVVSSAIAHLSERSSRFKKVDVYQRVFDHIEGVNLVQVDTALAKYPDLLDYGLIKNDPKRVGQLTTVKLLDRENRTIDRWLEGQGKAHPIQDRAGTLVKIDSIYKGSKDTLNQGQLEAITGVLGSTDQHQILHGLSGVSKIRTLKPLKTIAESEGITMRWFASSPDAAGMLSQELMAPAETLKSLVLTDCKIEKGEMLVIDEGGLVSAEMADILVQKANDTGARILLVGDTGKNRPVDAGNPVISLIEAGATTHNVAKIQQQTDDIQRQAVILASKGHEVDALNLLVQHNFVEEIPNHDERAQAIATAYLELSPEERAKTLIAGGTDTEKDRIVDRIRVGLKAEGSLGESVTIIQLRDRGWAKEHGLDIRNYQEGDYIAMSKALKKCPLIKDEFYKIIEVKDETIIVKSNSEKEYNFEPKKYEDKRVFSAQKIDIAIGDELRWLHTNQRKDQKNGATFTITGINGQIATIETSARKIKHVRLEPLAVDYTITTTNYRAHGSDRPRVFVAATDESTSKQDAFYISISKQIHELKIWTSSLSGLQNRVAMSNEQSNPLKGLKSDDFKHIDYYSSITTGEKSRAGLHWTIGGNTEYSQSQHNQLGQHSADHFTRYRGATKQAKDGGEQNTRSSGISIDHDRRNSSVSSGKSDAVGSTEQSTERADRRNESLEDVTRRGIDPLETIQDRIIEIAYQNRMGEALRQPLANLTRSLTELGQAQETHRQLLHEHAISQEQAKAVAIALKQWRESPDDRVDENIGYAINAVEPANTPDSSTEGHWGEDEQSMHPDLIALSVQELGSIETDEPQWSGTDYKSPLNESRGIFLPPVPDAIAQAIYKNHGIINASTEEFWAVVRDHNLPITITEGIQKTWDSLNLDRPTIGVSGFDALYLTHDSDGNKLETRQLNSDVAVFATPERKIIIAFDKNADTNMRQDIVHGVELLEDAGCLVNIAQWDTDTKEVDIAKQWTQAYATAISNAVPPDALLKAHYLSQYHQLAAQARANFPRESHEFIDTEVWLKAISKGDAVDGRRFVGAGAMERSADHDEYCQELLAKASKIRDDIIRPDELILEFSHRILEEDGLLKRNGERFYSGNNWILHSCGNDLSIRRKDGEIAYQVKGGAVYNNTDADVLHRICTNAVGSEQRNWCVRQ
jgi:conjugative relaxase-like TrwC/TraI family protein